MKSDETKKKLAELRLLLEKRWLTAGEVAVRLGVNRLTAYRRIRTLCGEGYKVRAKKVRVGTRGPLAVAYTTRPG